MLGLTDRFQLIDTVDTVITEPVQAPLTVEYARAHIKSLGHHDDLLIATWIRAAAQYFEGYTGRQIITGTRELWLDAFPGPRSAWPNILYWTGPRLELPRPPLQSVVSVLYVDGDGTVVPFSDMGSPETLYYQTKAPAGAYAPRGWVEPLAGLTWPIARIESGAVRIQYVAGYGDGPNDVPDLIRGVLCYLIGNFDQQRNSQAFRTGFVDFPTGVKTLIDEFKYTAMPTKRPRAGYWGMWGGAWR